MKVLVDTSAWLLVLRREERPYQDAARRDVARYIAHGEVVMIGPIQQEVLAAIETKQQTVMRGHFRHLHHLHVDQGDYEKAAFASANGSDVRTLCSDRDFLICTVASRRGLTIYATDAGLSACARVLKVTVQTPIF